MKNAHNRKVEIRTRSWNSHFRLRFTIRTEFERDSVHDNVTLWQRLFGHGCDLLGGIAAFKTSNRQKLS